MQQPMTSRWTARRPAGRVGRVCAALACALGIWLFGGSGPSRVAAAEAPSEQRDPLDSPTAIHELLYAQRFEPLLAAAAALDSVTLPREHQLEILRAAATIHTLRACQDSNPADREAAEAAMGAMLACDPRAEFVPGHRYPPAVHALFGDVRRSWLAEHDQPADPTRVAVAPFYLIDMGAGERFDWQAFADALPLIVTSDLQLVPGLVLLSREHMDAIHSELSLASEGDLVSAENRLRLQELLSAASFIYGEVQALPGDEIWLELRWVATETGATLLARHDSRRVRHGGELLDLEEGLVVTEFIPAMIAALDLAGGEAGATRAREHFVRKTQAASGGEAYLRYVAAVSAAAAAEGEGDIPRAIEAWRAAGETLPGDPVPRERIAALRLQRAYAPRVDPAPDAD